MDLAGGGLDDGGETVMCALVGGAIVGREGEQCVLVRVAEAGGADVRRELGLVDRWFFRA